MTFLFSIYVYLDQEFQEFIVGIVWTAAYNSLCGPWAQKFGDPYSRKGHEVNGANGTELRS